VSQDIAKDVAIYVAKAPSELMPLLDKQRAELDARASKINELDELVAPYLKKSVQAIPKIQYIEGSREVRAFLYQQLDHWRASFSGEDSTWWGYQDPSFVEHYKPWLEHAWKTQGENESICLLSSPAEVEDSLRGQVAGRTVKILPDNMNFSSTIWVVGSYVVMLMTSSPPHYAVQLREPLFSGNLRLLFKMLWESA